MFYADERSDLGITGVVYRVISQNQDALGLHNRALCTRPAPIRRSADSRRDPGSPAQNPANANPPIITEG